MVNKMNKTQNLVMIMKNKTFLKYYTMFKEWLRSTKTGIIVDRAMRFFVITVVTTFLTNYMVGQPLFPVLQSSLAVALIASYDKIKNLWFESIREEDTPIISTT